MAQSVQKVQKTVHPDTINITDKYYRALQSMKGKHPMGREGQHSVGHINMAHAPYTIYIGKKNQSCK